MADSKISALPAATVPLAGTEVLPIVQSSTTKQVSVANLTAGRAISASSVTNSALTSGRVTYAGTSGVLQDSANLTTDGTNLSLGAAASNYRLNIKGAGSAGDSSVYAQLTTLDTGTGFSDGLLVGVGIGASPIAYVSQMENADLALSTNATIRLNISNAGIVTMSAYGAGAATFSSAGVISSVSDETWKVKDGVPTNPDVMLQKLEPGYWFYNDEKKETFGTDRQLGFYAQNVHEAIGAEAAPTPEKVKDEHGKDTDVSKPWGYYDRSVLAVAVLSLQNALTTIEELKQRITALENK